MPRSKRRIIDLDSLSLIERVAMDLNPTRSLPPNPRAVTDEWIDYHILHDLMTDGYLTATEMARERIVALHRLEKRIKVLKSFGAIKPVQRKADARRLGVESLKTIKPCWTLTLKAKAAIMEAEA